MDLRQQLREARISRGLTTAQVAVRVGRTQSLVSRWETGTARMPDWETVVAWADAVGVVLVAKAASQADPFDGLRGVMTEEEAARLLSALSVVKKVS